MVVSSLKDWKRNTFSNITQSLVKIENMVETLNGAFEAAEELLGYENVCIRQQKNYLTSMHEIMGSEVTTCTSRVIPSVVDNIARFNNFLTDWHDMTMKFQMIMLNDFVLYNPVTQYSELIYDRWTESYYRTRETVEYIYVIDSDMYMNDFNQGLKRFLEDEEYCIGGVENQFQSTVDSIRENVKQCK